MGTASDFDLQPWIREDLLELAFRRIEERDARGLLALMDNVKCLEFTFMYQFALRARGMFEQALVRALGASRVNNRRLPVRDVLSMLRCANRAKLLAAGDPLPDGAEFVVYRGVAGTGSARRVLGYSWTLDLGIAAWFAERFEHLTDPGIFSAKVPRSAVFLRPNDHTEEEFIIDPAACRPRRLKLMRAQIAELAEAARLKFHLP